MKTVYFDTCVYNALIDDKNFWSHILSLKKANVIEVIFSDYIFNELVCTWKDGDLCAQNRTQRLFICVLELISNRILRQQEALINDEIKQFLNNSSKPNIFLNQKETETMKDTILRLAKGEKITNISCLLDVAEYKKHGHKQYKDIARKHNLHRIDSSPYKSFEEWYNTPLVKKYETGLIRKLLSEKIINNSNSGVIQKVIENSHNLLHLNSLLRMFAAYQFALLTYKKPLKGDIYDLKHFVCSASTDILVCDGDFLNIIKWVYPQKYCYTKDTVII